MGKYDAVLKRLPKLPVTDATRQEKINALKQQIRDGGRGPRVQKLLEELIEVELDLKDEEEIAKESEPLHGSHLAERYATVRGTKEAVAAIEKELGLWLDAYEQMVINQLENEGISSLTLVEGGTVRVQPEPRPVVEDRDQFRQWCINNDLARSLQLHSGTMASITKERLLKGEPEPDGVVAYFHSKIVFRP